MVAIDTLAYANRLKLAGMEPRHAEAQAEAVAEAMSVVVQDLQEVKQDLQGVKQDLRDIEHQLDGMATRQDLKEVENKLILRMGGMLFAAVSILSALLVILHIS